MDLIYDDEILPSQSDCLITSHSFLRACADHSSLALFDTPSDTPSDTFSRPLIYCTRSGMSIMLLLQSKRFLSDAVEKMCVVRDGTYPFHFSTTFLTL